MDLLEKHYGKRNFTLYSLFMAVPGTNSCYRKIFVTFSVVILSFSTIFQVMKFVTDGFTLKLIVELVPTIAATLGCLLYILYLTFATQRQFERILSVTENYLEEKRTVEENAILKQYTVGSEKFTNVVTATLIITSCGIPLVGFIPYYVDILMSINTTRRVELLFNGEIFIDQQKYFYYIYFIQSCTTVIVSILVLISMNISIILRQHYRCMIAILGYQLENLTEAQNYNISERINCEQLLTRRLQKYIKSHQKILEFADITAEFYDIPLTIILTGCFCALTMSLVQVTDPKLVSMKMIIFTWVQFCLFFLVSYMGQVGVDSSIKISENAYNAKWDVCSANIRKLLQLVILRSSKPCLIVARGIYVLSIENFLSVIQTIMSFYVVLRQAQ